MTDWKTAVAAVLLDAKTRADLTYEDLAKASGIPAISLKRYLKGHRPIAVEDFASIARALGIDPSELFAAVEARVQLHD